MRVKVKGSVSHSIITTHQCKCLGLINVRGQFGGFANLTGFNFAAAIEPGVEQLINYSIRGAVTNSTRKYKSKCWQ